MNVNFNAAIPGFDALKTALKTAKAGKGFSKATMQTLAKEGVDSVTLKSTQKALKKGISPEKITKNLINKLKNLKADEATQDAYRTLVKNNNSKFSFKRAFKQTAGFFEKAWNGLKGAINKYPLAAGIIGGLIIAAGVITLFSKSSDNAEAEE